MALGSNRDPREQELWLTADDLPKSPGHPFYEALQRVLRKADFDQFCEDLCRPFYSDQGRPSIPPGTYFRMLLIGYRAASHHLLDYFREFPRMIPPRQIATSTGGGKTMGGSSIIRA